ncbi:uncharacterized protein PRCAT00006191001 [Priceomyces carsonii]|uniref:uncharacterized protein n=1 Tax=Priceomyces carsonii TaxID=28549 RepID=UPI002EDA8FC5|nr:unnamed protein product [Priceomyces carsonii]
MTNEERGQAEEGLSQRDTNHKKSFDLSAIRNILEKDKNLEGVRNTDVDWFLRDPSVAVDSKERRKSDENDKGKEKDKEHEDQGDKENAIEKKHPKTTEAKTHAAKQKGEKDEGTISEGGEKEGYQSSKGPLAGRDDIKGRNSRPVIESIREEHETEDEELPRTADSSSAVNHIPQRPQDASYGRRNSASSIGSSGSNSGGFFSKIKEKISHKLFEENDQPPPPSEKPLFKENYDLRLRKTASNIVDRYPASENKRTKESDRNKLSRVASTPASGSNTDDETLEQYIKFYGQSDPSRGSRRSSINPESLERHEQELLKYQSEQCAGEGAKSGKISSFLRRRSSVTAPPREKTRDSVDSATGSTDSECSVEPLPKLQNAKNLKRVAFHSLTFLIDPPQQIPARKPRKGNVEVLTNGTIKVRPLTEEEKVLVKRSLMGKGGGIVVGGSGALGLVSPEEEKELKEGDLGQEMETAPDMEEAPIDKEDEENAIDKHAKLFAIDKPMVHHQRTGYALPVEKMALDLMYTRCCHLREILPIPAILKQIPKGSMAPIPMLQLKNPNPTMIEIQSFADFLRIAPIICISLDGVNLSLKQFKILLSAMCAKKQLEKLSLRNTPIDHEGWALLCWFLSRNRVLNRLDITQCPSLSVNLKRKKKKESDKKAEEVDRMKSNLDNRTDMDWALFTATIVARGGIEELILTGCCIDHIPTFEKLIKLALLIKTNRLGLAYSNLSVKQLEIVRHWLMKDFARGLDLGYNDFLSLEYMKVLLDMKKSHHFETKLSKSSLAFFSLNSCNLRFSEPFKEVFETILMKFPSLKYLDLSNNMQLFNTDKKPSSENAESEEASEEELNTITYFTSKFPMFPLLIRLHLENNNFGLKSLISIAEIIPFCRHLGYLSLLGNKLDLVSASALNQGLKNSNTLIALDCDYDDLPDFIKERSGLYTMRNMERMLYASKKQEPNKQDENSEAPSLTDHLDRILAMKAQHKLDLNSPEVSSFISMVNKIRQELKETVNELLKLQLKNELNIEGKETLIRLFFINSSIERGLQLIDPSLCDKNSFTFPTNLSLSEDEKNKYFKSSDSNEIAEASNFTPSKSHQTLSKSSSKTSLSSLDKQEGSMLRLLKLRDYHLPSAHAKADDEVGSADLSGEEIRERVLNTDFSDLDKMIAYLRHLRDKGVSLEGIFNMHAKHGKELQASADVGLDMDFLKARLQQLVALSTQHNDASPSSKDEASGSSDTQTNTNLDDIKDLDKKITKEADTSDSSEEVNKTIDHVLNNLTNL